LGFPIGSSIYLYADIQIKALGIILIILWFIGLYLVRVSTRMKENPIDIDAIKGRFRKIRRLYYQLLNSIPFVKPKKAEFRALKGASLTIEQGMFGLLGPNGAERLR
jgi:ABC-type multidrug transport system, ATPase component